MYPGFIDNFCILIDTREKKNEHLKSYWASIGVRYEDKKLDVGDYSFKLDDITFEDVFTIERKNSIDELCGNLTKGRERFEREFIRSREKFSFVFLLIEDGTYEDIINHNYRSQMHPNSLIGSLKAWKERYNIYIVFSEKKAAGAYMLDVFKRYINKYVFNGKYK